MKQYFLQKKDEDAGLEPKVLWPKRFLRERNTLKLTAVFLGLVIGVFCMKWIVDGLIEKTFGQEHKIVLPPKEKQAGKAYQNALVRTVIPPDEEDKQEIYKPARPEEIRRQVQLKANDYTVGYFGGISGLRLTVSNGSGNYINQVELVVNYLRKNGDILETSTYQVRSMQPHSSQTLSIPPTTKGVKITCKVMNIYARPSLSLKVI